MQANAPLVPILKLALSSLTTGVEEKRNQTDGEGEPEGAQEPDGHEPPENRDE